MTDEYYYETRVLMFKLTEDFEIKFSEHTTFNVNYTELIPNDDKTFEYNILAFIEDDKGNNNGIEEITIKFYDVEIIQHIIK